MILKTTLKKLSADIDKVLNDDAEANYYNGLIDGGEWSQCGPDFTNLIKRWKLTRRRLCLYAWVAEDYAKKFWEKYPGKRRYGYTDTTLNPWYNIQQNFDCIFMAGFLQHKPRRKTSVQFGIYPDGHTPLGHGPIN